MIYGLSKGLRQLVAVGLVGLVAGCVGVLVAAPLWAHIADLQDRIDQERMMVSRLTVAVADDSVRQTLERQTKAAKAAGLFIDGESSSIRLAALQSKLAGIAAANGIKLRSARNLPGREKDDLQLVGVQLQLVAGIGKLQKILLDIEQSKPSLFVDTLQVTPVAHSRVAEDEQPGLLDVRLDVFAVVARQQG
ncbi:MAG: type II secretion system protein GspM [Hyphomicrobiaceae bacterium]